MASRFKIFADFIKKQYPNAKTILCVSESEGQLAELLIDQYTVKAIDRQYGNKLVQKETFTKDYDITPFDLIVSMRPCEATEAIIKAAKNKPFAIVPCCHPTWWNDKPLIYGNRPGNVNYSNWIGFLQKKAKCEKETIKNGYQNLTILYREK